MPHQQAAVGQTTGAPATRTSQSHKSIVLARASSNHSNWNTIYKKDKQHREMQRLVLPFQLL